MVQIPDTAEIRQLREELQSITDMESVGDSHDVLQEHIVRVRELSERWPHTIQLLRETTPEDKPKLTCHYYTFGLGDSREVMEIVRRYWPLNVYPKGDYVSWMITNNVLIEVPECDVQDGYFIVYFSGAIIKHSGLYRDGKIHSKWGLGHLWEHAIHEVPANYGDEVRFYRNVSEDRCIGFFLDYAHEMIENHSR